MAIEQVNPLAIKEGAKGPKAKMYGSSPSNFDVMLDAVSAMSPTAMTAGGMYASPNSATVLAAAFSGINTYNAQASGYGGFAGAGHTPYLAGGYSDGHYMMNGMTGLGGLADPNAPVVPGAEGFSHMDMINTMNQNNLQLLELQAVMQSNMQAWNTKSNILAADHRARMAMIEKFTARG